jgi:predicted TIM-barrel fold metal-dependent hydrolase
VQGEFYVINHGGTIVAAHCGTCGFFDREDYYPAFIEMMNRYDNLYGDTAIMASLIRWRSLQRLSRESPAIRGRIVHGSDYPFPPARLPYLLRIGIRPPERENPLDMDLRIKQTFAFGPHYTSLLLKLLGLAR